MNDGLPHELQGTGMPQHHDIGDGPSVFIDVHWTDTACECRSQSVSAQPESLCLNMPKKSSLTPRLWRVLFNQRQNIMTL